MLLVALNLRAETSCHLLSAGEDATELSLIFEETASTTVAEVKQDYKRAIGKPILQYSLRHANPALHFGLVPHCTERVERLDYSAKGALDRCDTPYPQRPSRWGAKFASLRAIFLRFDPSYSSFEITGYFPWGGANKVESKFKSNSV